MRLRLPHPLPADLLFGNSRGAPDLGNRRVPFALDARSLGSATT